MKAAERRVPDRNDYDEPSRRPDSRPPSGSLARAPQQHEPFRHSDGAGTGHCGSRAEKDRPGDGHGPSAGRRALGHGLARGPPAGPDDCRSPADDRRTRRPLDATVRRMGRLRPVLSEPVAPHRVRLRAGRAIRSARGGIRPAHGLRADGGAGDRRQAVARREVSAAARTDRKSCGRSAQFRQESRQLGSETDRQTKPTAARRGRRAEPDAAHDNPHARRRYDSAGSDRTMRRPPTSGKARYDAKTGRSDGKNSPEAIRRYGKTE